VSALYHQGGSLLRFTYPRPETPGRTVAPSPVLESFDEDSGHGAKETLLLNLSRRDEPEVQRPGDGDEPEKIRELSRVSDQAHVVPSFPHPGEYRPCEKKLLPPVHYDLELLVERGYLFVA